IIAPRCLGREPAPRATFLDRTGGPAYSAPLRASPKARYRVLPQASPFVATPSSPRGASAAPSSRDVRRPGTRLSFLAEGSMRNIGTVKWFNDAKGFGFITPEGG